MTWIGWDDWTVPDGYCDVPEIWPAWQGEGQLVIFFCGRLIEGDGTYLVLSQRCSYDSDAQLTPDDDVNTIAVLDTRDNWHIMDVQRADDGTFGVKAQRLEVVSA